MLTFGQVPAYQTDARFDYGLSPDRRAFTLSFSDLQVPAEPEVGKSAVPIASRVFCLVVPLEGAEEIAELASLASMPSETGAASGQAGGAAAAGTAPGGADAAAALVNSLGGASGGLLASASGSTAPGIVARGVFVDSRGITLRETFERPMAFAVQAIGFDASTPEARASLCSNPRPQAANPGAHR